MRFHFFFTVYFHRGALALYCCSFRRLVIDFQKISDVSKIYDVSRLQPLLLMLKIKLFMTAVFN